MKFINEGKFINKTRQNEAIQSNMKRTKGTKKQSEVTKTSLKSTSYFTFKNRSRSYNPQPWFCKKKSIYLVEMKTCLPAPKYENSLPDACVQWQMVHLCDVYNQRFWGSKRRVLHLKFPKIEGLNVCLRCFSTLNVGGQMVFHIFCFHHNQIRRQVWINACGNGHHFQINQLLFNVSLQEARAINSQLVKGKRMSLLSATMELNNLVS